MPPALTSAGTLTCPHGGTVTHRPGQSTVLVAGAPALTQQDAGTVVGCAFTVPGKPSPCSAVRWTAGAGQVRVGGLPVLHSASTGLCSNAEQAPQGPPIVLSTQPRVVVR
ncbi:hypothetical protein [Pseudonocardia sp.]|uniref:hypothetical protein n=1 Tax=Pseudonocardia sp. TaxID=60912 RepID=UPI003D10473B